MSVFVLLSKCSYCSGMEPIAEVLDAVMNGRVVGRTVGDLGSHIMRDEAVVSSY